MTEEISQELAQEMAALINAMAKRSSDSTDLADYISAVQIYSKLPKPVDPDLIEARRMVARDVYGDPNGYDMLHGSNEASWVEYAHRGIKRGKEIAAEDKR